MPAEEQNRSRRPVASFFGELKRRRVLHMGGAYIAGAWLGAEILGFLLEQFLAPAWTYRFVGIVLVVGFPLTMVLAWIVQVQEDGSWAIDPSRGDYRTVAVAIALGVLATTGLSWLIVPEREPGPVYEALPNSLAVLPFPGDDELYRVLMAGLEQSRDLSLVRLDTAKTPDDLLSFGRSLRVKALAYARLAGADGGKVFEIELLDAVRSENIWASSFERDSSRMIETGLAIANGLLEALALPALLREEFTGTENDEAFAALLAGMAYTNSVDPDSLAAAMENFQQAVELDPGCVAAHIGLAQTIYDLLAYGRPGDEESATLQKRAADATAHVMDLAPSSADAIYLVGLFHPNPQLGIQAFERAIELDPDHYKSYFYYATLMKEAGKLEDAERLIKRALLFQPMNSRFKKALSEVTQLQSSGEYP